MKKGHLVVLTGAGISAESGLRTFRDSDGLWEENRIEDVATSKAWDKDPELVLKFYNMRRLQLAEVRPNKAHDFLKLLEKDWQVSIITQNVDDLHERAGSNDILHLHGELRKVRSVGNPSYIKDIEYSLLNLGEKCPSGHQLRPHIVWFGEDVPLIHEAERIASSADVLLIIGTSLNVYPAAGLAHASPLSSPIILVDPAPSLYTLDRARLKVVNEKATIGIPIVAEYLNSL